MNNLKSKSECWCDSNCVYDEFNGDQFYACIEFYKDGNAAHYNYKLSYDISPNNKKPKLTVIENFIKEHKL